MKDSEQRRFLREILAGDELSNLRQASLESGLKWMRQQRRRRAALRACALLCLPALLALALIYKPAREIEQGHPAEAVQVRLPQVAPSIELITDEQLFALFPGRAMALIGKPGQQQVLFLEGSTAADGPRPVN